MATEHKKRMIEEMDIRGLEEETKICYLRSMKSFTSYHKKTPDQLDLAEIKSYQRYLLKERKLAPNSVNNQMSGIRFFYRAVMERHWYYNLIPRVKVKRKMPQILTESEIGQMITSVDNLFWKALIMLTYSAGLRQSEVRNLKITDIDSDRMNLHIRDGKYGDRQALLAPITLRCLRMYWRVHRLHNKTESDWLFMPTKNSYNGVLKKKLSHTAFGYIISKAADLAGIKKKYTRIFCATLMAPTF